MYQAFVKIYQRDKGKEIVQSHRSTFDAHTIYKELSEQYMQSTAAQLNQ